MIQINFNTNNASSILIIVNAPWKKILKCVDSIPKSKVRLVSWKYPYKSSVLLKGAIHSCCSWKKIGRIQVPAYHNKLSKRSGSKKRTIFHVFCLIQCGHRHRPEKTFSVQVHSHKRHWFMYVLFWPRAVATLNFWKILSISCLLKEWRN